MTILANKYARLDAILATAAPAHLFHYTSPAGLLGIAESKSIWATNVAYMNDLKETAHAGTVAELALTNRLESRPYKGRYSDEERELLTKMAAVPQTPWPFVYVSSLTEERDLLSQWRAYCPATGGFSLGFPTPFLKSAAAAQGFVLCPCVYDHDEQYRLVGEVVDVHVESFRSFLASGPLENPDEEIKRRADNFQRELLYISPVLKHKAFSEEKEWRLIGFRWSHAPDIRFRIQRGAIVPYLQFSLDTAPDGLSLVTPGSPENSVGIVLGPTTDLSNVLFAATEVAMRHFGQGYWYSQSQAPYKGT